jgi:hypothetical protein
MYLTINIYYNFYNNIIKVVIMIKTLQEIFKYLHKIIIKKRSKDKYNAFKLKAYAINDGIFC